MQAGQSPLQIELGRLSLWFEFNQRSVGHLSIILKEESSEPTPSVMALTNIPTDHEMKLKSHQEAARLSFCIQIEQGYLIEIEFHWETP